MPFYQKLIRNSDAIFIKSELINSSIIYINNWIWNSWTKFWQSHPSIFSSSNWVRWSPPEDLLAQVWEWEPLIGFHSLTHYISDSAIPWLRLPLILIILSITLISFIAALMKQSYILKFSIHCEREIISYFNIRPINKYKNIFPSFNKAELQSNMISAHPVGNFPSALHKQLCDTH